MWIRRIAPFLLALALVTSSTLPAAASSQGDVVTTRLGISAGDAIQDAPLGTTGRALAELIPMLSQTASAYGVRINAVSVGQGFWSEDGQVMSEHDLDLVVTGPRDNVNALAATLGMSWDQSAVYVFHGTTGPLATATIPIPGGADALTPDVYQALVAELVDGGHVKYAGAESLLFVAKTGDEPDDAFFERMERVRQILELAGVATGQVVAGSTDFMVLDSDNYVDYILPMSQGKAA